MVHALARFMRVDLLAGKIGYSQSLSDTWATDLATSRYVRPPPKKKKKKKRKEKKERKQNDPIDFFFKTTRKDVCSPSLLGQWMRPSHRLKLKMTFYGFKWGHARHGQQMSTHSQKILFVLLTDLCPHRDAGKFCSYSLDVRRDLWFFTSLCFSRTMYEVGNIRKCKITHWWLVVVNRTTLESKYTNIKRKRNSNISCD